MTTCTAFEGTRRIASGELADVAFEVKAALKLDPGAQILIFDDATGHPIDLDLRGASSQKPPAARPGRPKLGVIAREVTLLPRHWEWLATQPGGASVALRKLVEHARRANEETDRRRVAQEAAYRFIHAVAGNAPGFEEAARALFAGRQKDFEKLADGWPADVAAHAKRLAAAAFLEETAQE